MLTLIVKDTAEHRTALAANEIAYHKLGNEQLLIALGKAEAADVHPALERQIMVQSLSHLNIQAS